MGAVWQAVLAAAGIALIVTAAVLAYGAKGWFTVSAVAPSATKAESGVLRYAPDSAQLSVIKVKRVEVFPVPADENLRAIRVPNTALVSEGPYSYVFVERSPGVFARRRVELAVQDRDYSYLESGIDAGERIVVTGSALLNSALESGQ